VSTIAEQPAVHDLRARRPKYVRVMPTPVSDRAVTNTLYIASSIFLGEPGDMDDIVAAIEKVERALRGRTASKP
jgi:hypothetical protein